MSKTEEIVLKTVEEKVLKLGYEIEYIEVVKEGKDNFVRIVIDKEGSLTTEDCEKVSRSIEDDVEKAVKLDSYILEISSPGLERQLKNVDLYKKYIGEKVNIRLYKKINDSKEFEGILKNVIEDAKIVIEVSGNDLEIDLKDIACGNTVYDFKEGK